MLVSVAPAGVLHAQRQDREFNRWLADRGRMEELPDGSFEASGTGVATALLTLEKRSDGWKRRPFQGWVSWNAWQTALWADNTSELYEQELQIYERIRRGDFGRAPFDEGASWPLTAAARAFYEEATEQLNRRPLYAGVYCSDEDHRALLRHLTDRYQEYVAYPEGRDAPIRIAA